MKQEKIYIYGKHALMEALMNIPKAVKKVFLSPEARKGELGELVLKHRIAMGELTGTVSKEAESGSHQGVIGLISVENLVQSYDDFMAHLTIGSDTLLVLLDELQDPHNVGAIIRSAAGLGATAILLPEHNQAPITGAVVKVSAGMAFRIPLVQLGNVNTTVRDLKDRGFWIYGLEGESGNSITEEKFEKPTVLILGNESKGIRLKTRELCDILLSIPLKPLCESLNVAASAAVALYAWSTHHRNAVKK